MQTHADELFYKNPSCSILRCRVAGLAIHGDTRALDLRMSVSYLAAFNIISYRSANQTLLKSPFS
jgi:hypothetical protein